MVGGWGDSLKALLILFQLTFADFTLADPKIDSIIGGLLEGVLRGEGKDPHHGLTKYVLTGRIVFEDVKSSDQLSPRIQIREANSIHETKLEVDGGYSLMFYASQGEITLWVSESCNQKIYLGNEKRLFFDLRCP